MQLIMTSSGCQRMMNGDQIFLSYSRNDRAAAETLREQLKRYGLSVFKDDDSIYEGDLWLVRLQEAVVGCSGFVVLVGRDGVERWIGAETQAALSRYFAPHDDAERLPIFPVLLGDTRPETLPVFLRLFQATSWNGADDLPESLLEQIRKRTSVAGEPAFDGCPFVGLKAFAADQAHLFFGRQKDTLDALARFDTRRGSSTVRWLEINGNSGSGKSSLMNAGLLPLIDQGWLWPQTGLAHWRRIGPLTPGAHPVVMLAEGLARDLGGEIADVRLRLEEDDQALAMWLRTRKEKETAFLLAIDQFEELFTFADPDERRRFDRLLATALEDSDCPLFVISTVRSDFLDRFETDLPQLAAESNRRGRAWRLPPIGTEGLREVISGPARMVGLDVSDVQEAMVAAARDEPGALPLVENALHWLWEQREGNRLSARKFHDQGGLAGILSLGADQLLRGRGPKGDGAAHSRAFPRLERRMRSVEWLAERLRRWRPGSGQSDPALELLFWLVHVDPEGRRHTRRRIPLAEAVAVAGGGARGQAVVDRLAGRRELDNSSVARPLRLITVTKEAVGATDTEANDRWVSLIHETLIRSKGLDDKGKPQPYWPTLWGFIEANKYRATRREPLHLLAEEWNERTGLKRLFGLAGCSGLLKFRGLAVQGSLEQRYLRWSAVRCSAEAVILAGILGLLGEGIYWTWKLDLPLEALATRWAYKFGQPLALPELVKIPRGEFVMGSYLGYKQEMRAHRVAIDYAFDLSMTEVTFDQYDVFCAAMGRDQPRNHDGWGRGNRPVINVDWGDAGGYALWLGKMTGRTCRLPSEAEWEYAARAGTTAEYALPAPGGSDNIEHTGLANCVGCGGEWDKQTAPVASFDPNGWGLHDMHGNVSEWVEDCWHESYREAPDDGRAWLEKDNGNCNLRVVRGGSWNGSPVRARSASRSVNDPDVGNEFVGFRVLCSFPIFDH